MKYLLCVFDFFNKDEWVVHLNEKRGITIVKIFQKLISKGRRPNKIWFDQDSEF